MRSLPGFASVALFVAVAAGACSSESDDAGSGGNAGAAGSATGGSAGSGTGGATGGAAGAGASGGAGGTAGSAASGSGGSGGSGGSAGTGTPWSPPPGTSWQWQLTGTIDESVDVAMYDVDLFETPKATVASLHSKGRIVICYFSAGSREDWRPDAGEFQAADYGKKLDNWPGENWLDIRSANVRAIMKKRLDLAVDKGCDGVEPDNVDGESNDTGFPLSKQDQLDYNGFLATESHARSLSVGLKNALELVPDLVSQFDWALNEECLSYSECDLLKPFLNANKAVFHVEYVDQPSQGAAKQTSVCGDSTITGFSTLIKTWDLDAWRLACP